MTSTIRTIHLVLLICDENRKEDNSCEVRQTVEMRSKSNVSKRVLFKSKTYLYL
jgi:hypothetical protein